MLHRAIGTKLPVHITQYCRVSTALLNVVVMREKYVHFAIERYQFIRLGDERHRLSVYDCAKELTYHVVLFMVATYIAFDGRSEDSSYETYLPIFVL